VHGPEGVRGLWWELPEGSVRLHSRVLTISDERKVKDEVERAGYYVRELRHGWFRLEHPGEPLASYEVA
jgi:hypothetical protein